MPQILLPKIEGLAGQLGQLATQFTKALSSSDAEYRNLAALLVRQRLAAIAEEHQGDTGPVVKRAQGSDPRSVGAALEDSLQNVRERLSPTSRAHLEFTFLISGLMNSIAASMPDALSPGSTPKHTPPTSFAQLSGIQDPEKVLDLLALKEAMRSRLKTVADVLKKLELAFSRVLSQVMDSREKTRAVLTEALEILNRLQDAINSFEDRVVYDVMKRTEWKEGLQGFFRQSRFELSVDQLDSCVSELKSHHLPEEPSHQIASLLRDAGESIDQIKSLLVGGGSKTPRGVRVPTLG